MKKILNIKSFMIVMLISMIIVSTLLFIYTKNRKSVFSDGVGYYSYLPAIFIDNDISFNTRLNQIALENNDTLPKEKKECPSYEPICNEYYGMNFDNGIWENKYPVGLSLLFSPFFFTADILTIITNGDRNGTSELYQYSIALCGMIFYLIGIYFSYKIFIKRFSKNISLLLVLILTFGTGLFHYTVHEPSMSHVYSFSLITLCIYLLDKYNERASNKLLVLIGINIALIGLIRNTNFIFALIPIYSVINATKSNLRLNMFFKIGILWTIITLIVFIPQFLYWHYSTGLIISTGYTNETFNLLNPKLLEILFDPRAHGFFIWHPIFLFSIPGFFLFIKSKEAISRISLLIVLVYIYLFSSWWAYWFGFAFGYRPLIDFYILLFIPIGYFISYVFKQKKIIRYLFTLLILSLIYLNIMQINNYWRGIVADHNLTIENYFNNIGKLNIDIEKNIKKLFGN